MTAITATEVSLTCLGGGYSDQIFTGQGNAITENCNQSLERSQRRFLRRICNGRTVPIIVDGQPFLTYKEVSRYLLSLQPDAREKAYADMRNSTARE